MIRQIRYFQAIVRNNSFSGTAEECHISHYYAEAFAELLKQKFKCGIP